MHSQYHSRHNLTHQNPKPINPQKLILSKKNNQQFPNIKKKKKKIRSDQIYYGRSRSEQGWEGGPLLCDRCDSTIGATGWLGLARHELGERESKQRERKRAVKRPVWLGVAQDGWGWLGTMRKRADSEREREREQRKRVDSERERERKQRLNKE
jgi:hypothetical protein